MELHLGGDGEMEPALRARAETLGIASQVRWLGGTFDVATTLASAHVFVTASESETFGIAALEAMAVGLPVVTCDNGGVSELIEDGVCGTLVRATADPAAANGLADALCALAADPGRRAAWGAAAAERARALFSPAAMAQATAAVYRGERRSR
jgi:glycosyltransferase involved in cell wall biosynthesis